MTCSVSAVFAVMITVPAVRTPEGGPRGDRSPSWSRPSAPSRPWGFEPVISLARFEYTTLALSLVGALMIVYRLGAGLHGLGTPRRPARSSSAACCSPSPSRTPSCCAATAPPVSSSGSSTASAGRATELGAFPRPDRGRARHPGPRLGLPHACPAAAGLVGLRLRRRGHRAGREQRPQRHGHPHRVGARACCTPWWSGSWSASSLIRADVAATGTPRPARRAGPRRRPPSGRSRRAPARCSEPPDPPPALVRRPPGGSEGCRSGRSEPP